MLGKLRSGKSTCVGIIKEYVKELSGFELINKPLAKPIYDAAKLFYKSNDLTWRKNRRLLEGMGEAYNNDYPNGDKLIEIYDEQFNLSENIIVEDCRRKTQADYFRTRDSVLIRIKADAEVRKARCKPGEWAEGHVSDTELDDYPVDFEIENNGEDLQVLKESVYREVICKLYERDKRET